MLKVYPKEKNVIKHRVKKAIAINERKPFVSSDELGLDLSAISNPILKIRNCIQPPPLRTWLHLIWRVKDDPLKLLASF